MTEKEFTTDTPDIAMHRMSFMWINELVEAMEIDPDETRITLRKQPSGEEIKTVVLGNHIEALAKAIKS